MTVASWEYWSVAKMLIASHGTDAESVAEENLETAFANGHSGNIIVWREIRRKIDEMRLQEVPLDPQR